jgi:hypothetical protein
MDTVGEFGSGHQLPEWRRPRRGTGDASQPVRDPVDVDRLRRRHVLQAGLGQTEIVLINLKFKIFLIVSSVLIFSCTIRENWRAYDRKGYTEFWEEYKDPDE